jgi:multidrug efflux system membrane fusion protein
MRRTWIWLGAALGVVALIGLSWTRLGLSAGSAAPKAAPVKAVPVVAAAATIGDFDLTETGLGTVAPLATVTVRSRVDGELVKVAYREGQNIRRGDVMAEIDPRAFQVQVLQAEGQLAKDEAALANAKVDLERYRVLIAQDSIPRQQLDTQVATVDEAAAAVKSDEAQVASARLSLSYCKITAPISGVVGLRLVDQGNMVHANDPNGLAVMTQQQPISVVFTIPADHLPPLLLKMKGGDKLAVEAWDRDLRRNLATGSVLAVDNQIDPTTGTVRIKSLFANDDLALFPNQFVNARLHTDTLHGVVLIPSAAIERSAKSTYVYVVGPDATVAMKNVTVAATSGDVTAIGSGIAAGELVVVDGLDKLQPGAKVILAKDGGSGKTSS